VERKRKKMKLPGEENRKKKTKKKKKKKRPMRNQEFDGIRTERSRESGSWRSGKIGARSKAEKRAKSAEFSQLSPMMFVQIAIRDARAHVFHAGGSSRRINYNLPLRRRLRLSPPPPPQQGRGASFN